jgi:peptidyl-prolyl cis-trans isomerase SurA
MVDEILVSDSAKQRGLSVTPQELVNARQAMIAGGVPEETIVRLEKDYRQTFIEKLRADLLWEKTVLALIRPRIQIGTAEIDRVLENMLQNRQVVEREIGHIMLKDGDGAEARMQEILKQLEGGARFEDLAKSSSEDEATAKNGGYMGWFASGDLNPELEIALDRLQAGNASGIIRTPDGWHILKLINTRSTKPLDVAPVRQYQLYLAGYDGERTKEKDAQVEAFVKDHRKGFDVNAAFADNKAVAAGDASRALGWISLKDLAPEWQEAMAKTKVGEWTSVTVAGKTTGRLFVAETREVVPDELTKLREKVNQQLYGNRMELETRRYLRELRQRAFVDVRL